MISPVSEADYSQYFSALMQGDHALCLAIARSLLSSDYTIFDLYEQLFKRSLYDIGELWTKNMITVADEHIATAITERLISQLNPTGTERGQTPQQVIISCVASDLHQIGAKMVSNLFEYHGWNTFYLGANMPITDLLDAIDRLQPDIICLSLGMVEHFRTLEITIREIQLRNPQSPVVVGGQAFAIADPATHNLDRFQNVHILQSLNQIEQFISGIQTPQE